MISEIKRTQLLNFAAPIVCVCILIGAAVYSFLVPYDDALVLADSIGERSRISGVVIKDPERRENTKHVVVEVEMLNGELIHEPVRTLLYADRHAAITYGNRIEATGILAYPEAFETDTGRIFDYASFLRAHGIAYTMSYPDISIINSEGGTVFMSGLISLKHFLIRGMQASLPEPESSLLEGLLLGERQSLGDSITDAMRNAGVVHIIVLSGYNVALVITWISFITLALLPRNAAFAVTACFVIAFALLTGASETTIRATLMALIMMMATVLNRPTMAFRSLLFAAAIMALINPHIVLYDLSFQLSVLATLGLILFSAPIEKMLTYVPATLKLREIVATTIATQITVLPLLVLSIGAISLVFLPANALVLPAVPIAMFLGFVSSLIASLSVALAFPVSFVAYAVLSYIIDVSVWFGTLPYSAVTIDMDFLPETFIVLAAIYGFVFLAWFYYKKAPVRGL